MKKPGQFDYVNQYYNLKLQKHTPVVLVKTGQRGQVVKGDGQYIHIQWDGEPKPRGPYHPVDGLTYPEVAT